MSRRSFSNLKAIENSAASVKLSSMLLFHGTSHKRYLKIISENRLRVSPRGTGHLSMTADPVVATYFAWIASYDDKSFPVIIPISIIALFEAGYELKNFSDPIWGAEQCDWEQEICCPGDIYPLSKFLAEPQRGATYPKQKSLDLLYFLKISAEAHLELQTNEPRPLSASGSSANAGE